LVLLLVLMDALAAAVVVMSVVAVVMVIGVVMVVGVMGEKRGAMRGATGALQVILSKNPMRVVGDSSAWAAPSSMSSQPDAEWQRWWQKRVHTRGWYHVDLGQKPAACCCCIADQAVGQLACLGNTTAQLEILLLHVRLLLLVLLLQGIDHDHRRLVVNGAGSDMCVVPIGRQL
jgi:hypothetical protein